MKRREVTKIVLGVGFSGVSADLDGYFDGWERYEWEAGVHYWTRDENLCIEYKDYQYGKIVVAYTIHEVGELDQFLLKTEVESEKEAERIIRRIRTR